MRIGREISSFTPSTAKTLEDDEEFQQIVQV